MTDCLNDEMRDRLPLLALGVLPSTEEATLRTHVASCASCSAEVELLDRSRRVLDASVPAPDVAAIVALLPAPRLRVVPAGRPAAAPASRGGRMPRAYIAAAASLLIVGSLASPWFMRNTGEPVGVGAPDTSVAVLPIGVGTTTLPDPIATTATHSGLSVDGGLSDLSDDDLKALLLALDGLEGTIATEPVALRAPIVDGTGGI